MRTIKFRAWDKKNKKYFYPKDYDERIVLQLNGVIGLQNKHKVYDVATDEFIIEQFTGLKDKNGVEIYEGDVVTYSGVTSGGGKIVRHIHYDVERLTYMADAYIIYGHDQKILEVIGNIHEQKEMK